MIEAIKFWNEPNNKSYWAFEIDPEWQAYAQMVKLAAHAAKAEKPGILRVLGGISPIDPHFIKTLERHGSLKDLDAVAVLGFPRGGGRGRRGGGPDGGAGSGAGARRPGGGT